MVKRMTKADRLHAIKVQQKRHTRVMKRRGVLKARKAGVVT